MDRRVRYHLWRWIRPRVLSTRKGTETNPSIGRFLALPLLLSLAGMVAAMGSLERSILVSGGTAREYLLFTPSQPASPAPLLMVLHGRGGSGAAMAKMTRLHDLAERDGVFVVFPEGLERQWNYLTGIGGNNETDDVRFLEDLAEDLVGRFPLDRSRLAVAGFSNGGFMAQRLACEPATPFMAFAVVAAAGFGGMPGICDAAGPRSILLIHGTDDGVVPWRGSWTMLQGRAVMLSAPVPETFAFWVDRGGCREVVRREVESTDEQAAHMLSAVGCRAERSVVFYVLQGGDHRWPVAVSSSGFDASTAVWRFLDGLDFYSRP